MFGLNLQDIIIMAIGTLSLVVWLVFYFSGMKYGNMFDQLDDKEFPLSGIYGVGYAVLEMFHYSYKSRNDRKLRAQIEVLYGEKYTEYYLRVIHAQQLSFAMTIFVLAFVFYGVSQEIGALAICIMFSGLAYYYFGKAAEKKIQIRSEELLHDFSEMVSKLALLTNAGMILRDAWRLVAENGEGTIYKEMKTAVDEMNNGVSDIDAVRNFGSRCMIPEIKKFSATVIQGLSESSRELVRLLHEQSKEVWQLKKNLVRREGEKAASKLLFPICTMFIGILILILVPIFSNIGM